jgi:hypothetical protein
MADPVVYKTTLVFELGSRGWTESYHYTTAALDYRSASKEIEGLAEARAAMLGRQAFIKGYRVSRQDEKNEGFITYKRYEGDKDKDCAQPDVALLVTAYDILKAKKKNIYLRGIWDDWEVEGGKFVFEDKAWKKLFAAWSVSLVSPLTGFGWWGIVGRSRANVTDMIADEEDRLTFSFASDVFPPGTFGTKQKIRLTGINGRSGLNGEHIVEVIGARSCITAVPTRSVTYRFGGRVQFANYGFIKMNALSAQKVTSRDSGSPLLESRGRQRAQPRG